MTTLLTFKDMVLELGKALSENAEGEYFISDMQVVMMTTLQEEKFVIALEAMYFNNLDTHIIENVGVMPPGRSGVLIKWRPR